MKQTAIALLLLMITLQASPLDNMFIQTNFGGVSVASSKFMYQEYYSSGDHIGNQYTYPYIAEVAGGYLFTKPQLSLFVSQYIGYSGDTNEPEWSFGSSATNLGVGKKIPLFFSTINFYGTVGFLREKCSFIRDTEIELTIDSPLFQIGTDLQFSFLPVADFTVGYRMQIMQDKSDNTTNNGDEYYYYQGTLQHIFMCGVHFHKKNRN